MSDSPDDLMANDAARLVAGVEDLGGPWVVDAVMRIVDAWGRFDAAERDRIEARARTAGSEAARRVATALRALFDLDVADQRVTPLQIIRSLRLEATAVLEEAGIPGVERDEYDERSFPDDIYGLVLKSPVELGDDELGGALLAWGVGKAKVLRARAIGDGPG